MGFPSESFEGLFRNKLADVQRFLNALHANHFKVYNLCAERKYDHEKFDGRVAEFPFHDHCAPPLALILQFCVDAEAFLDADPANVVVVHCKAGKGRTGTCIACLLLYMKSCRTASEAIHTFGQNRTLNGRGITIPSQERSVRYFEQVALNRANAKSPPPPLPERRAVVLTYVSIHALPRAESCEPWISITQKGKTVFNSKPLKLKKETNDVTISCDHTVLNEDVFIQFFNKSSKCMMFSCSFHTAYLKENMLLWKCDLDKACKDTSHKTYPQGFHLQLFFKEFTSQAAAQARCFACQQPIAPNSTTAHTNNRVWHWQCALCCKCSKHVGDSCTFTNEDLPLCLACASGTVGFFNFCEGCGNVIDTDSFEEHGKLAWHTWCFRCCGCAALLTGIPEITVHCKKLYCGACSSKLQPPPELQPPPKGPASSSVPATFVSTVASLPVGLAANPPAGPPPRPQPTANPSNAGWKRIAPSNASAVCARRALCVSPRRAAPPSAASAVAECAGCGSPLSTHEKQVLALGKYWHRTCFRCHQCKREFPGNQFYAWDNMPYCSTCEEALRVVELPVCATCNKPISEPSYVSTEGTSYHHGCFVCVFCGSPISGNYFKRDRNIYCHEDYERLFAVSCQTCGKAILDNQIRALGACFHAECWVCSSCKKPLGDAFFELNHEPVCEPCGLRLTQVVS
eukprot:TRINITY_DN3396_c0_g1_i3.p1 TRINITY_DN3396_c0_g1~~TRINITY_DN3396_c0_g1_i3.p1  ORF type:complete len:740 (-),score=89.19 TRINITY_DN3396_c0_g1_i3:23-2080(-)